MMQKPVAAKTSIAASTKAGTSNNRALCIRASVVGTLRVSPTAR